MKQLDVDVRQPANIMTFRLGLSHLTLTHVTFDLTRMTFNLEHYPLAGQMRPENHISSLTTLTCDLDIQVRSRGRYSASQYQILEA